MTDLQKTPAKVSLHSFSDLLQKTTENGKIYICMQVQTGNLSFSLKDWNFNYATYEHTYTKATNPPSSTFACSPPSTTFASCTACVPSSQFVYGRDCGRQRKFQAEMVQLQLYLQQLCKCKQAIYSKFLVTYLKKNLLLEDLLSNEQQLLLLLLEDVVLKKKKQLLLLLLLLLEDLVMPKRQQL